MRHFLVILFLISALNSFAQQGLQMEFGEVDSVAMLQNRQLEYYQFISGNFGNDFLLDEIQLPQFNTRQEYQQRYAIKFELLPLISTVLLGNSSSYFGAYSPFFHNGQILSEAAYNVGDKFVIGGFSYGANSLNSAPFPNQNSSYFDTHGSTMFLQYKVSKNFKIETRVSVTQGRGSSMGF